MQDRMKTPDTRKGHELWWPRLNWSRRRSGTWACHLFLNLCPLPRTLQFLCTLTGTPQEPSPVPLTPTGLLIPACPLGTSKPLGTWN